VARPESSIGVVESFEQITPFEDPGRATRRKDGALMRSGSCENGEQIGVRTTYDKNGKVVKVTTIKPKKAK
jgi:antitoxin component YwqK of YwqJK toxin-antitoxin module